MDARQTLKDKKRIIIKIGSSSLTHPDTENLNLHKIEKLVRILTDLRSRGKDVVLVSSGAIAVGRKAFGCNHRPATTAEKQALAAIGQARLMMTYERLFGEYNQLTAQILMTKDTMTGEESRTNARNTFEELFRMGVIPVVNENDTVATHEIEFGDNDRMSALVTGLIGGDLLILLSDIDGLYTDDPHLNPNAVFIEEVPEITKDYLDMGKDTGSTVGTGGMMTKLIAAKMAADAGADMVIANGNDVENIFRIIDGEKCGTLFLAHKDINFDLLHYMENY